MPHLDFDSLFKVSLEISIITKFQGNFPMLKGLSYIHPFILSCSMEEGQKTLSGIISYHLRLSQIMIATTTTTPATAIPPKSSNGSMGPPPDGVVAVAPVAMKIYCA